MPDQPDSSRTHRPEPVGAADLSLRLDGPVTDDRLGQLVGAWSRFLRAVGRSVAGTSQDAVRFVLTRAEAGSFRIDLRPQRIHAHVPPSVVPAIGPVVTRGLQELDRQAVRPRHFTDPALAELRRVASSIDARTQALRVAHGSGAPVPLSPRAAAHVKDMLAPDTWSIGTIEGHIKGLVIEDRKLFYVQEVLTGRKMTCHLGPNVSWQSVHEAFDKRVAVTGRIEGDERSMKASMLYVFPPDEDLPTADQVRGILKGVRQ